MSAAEWAEVFHSEPPEAFGRFSGPLVVAASGWSLKEDLAKAPECPVMGVNHAGMFIYPMMHWFSCHWEGFAAWKQVRRFHVTHGGTADWQDQYVTHCKQGGHADMVWPLSGRFARLGGLSAIFVGLAMGYAPIYLAGMPMDAGGHFYPSEPGPVYDFGQDELKNTWSAVPRVFRDKVRNLHGD